MAAPAGTTLVRIEGIRFIRTFSDSAWVGEQLADAATLESCRKPPTAFDCTLGRSGGESSAYSFTGLAADEIRIGVRCAPETSSSCAGGGSEHHATAVLYSATVTVDDPVVPTVGAPSGALFGGGWLKGVRSAGVSGRDSTGVDRLQLRRDGGVVVRSEAKACDFTYAAPCATPGVDVPSGWADVDTATWPDGSHAVVAAVRDAGGNEGIVTRMVQTDNTAPIAPLGAGPVDGVVWSANAMRQLGWTLPSGQAAPIAAAHVGVCPSGGGACVVPAGVGLTSAGVTLPSPGLYTGSVYLTDEAGNGSAANVATFELGYDDGTPPAPVLGAPQATGGGAFVVPVDVSGDPGPAPVARLDGELCPAGGGGTCEAIPAQTETTSASVTVPGPGDWVLTLRAVDAAQNAGASATAVLSYAPPAETPTPTPAPSATSEPTATATPSPVVRRTPQLRFTRRRLTRRRLAVRGVTSPPATGFVTLTVPGRRPLVRRTKVRAGAFRLRVALPKRLRGTAKLRVRIRYGGDENYAPRAIARTVRRRA